MGTRQSPHNRARVFEINKYALLVAVLIFDTCPVVQRWSGTHEFTSVSKRLDSFCWNHLSFDAIQDTVDCTYPWTLAQKKNVFTWLQTSMFQVLNFEVSPPKLKLTWSQTSMFQVSNFEVSPPKCSPQCPFASLYQWFSQVFLRFRYCDDSKLSEPREHRLCRENFTFGRENVEVWNLIHSRLRSRKLKFGRGNFHVWHLKHRRLTSRENMFFCASVHG